MGIFWLNTTQDLKITWKSLHSVYNIYVLAQNKFTNPWSIKTFPSQIVQGFYILRD